MSVDVHIYSLRFHEQADRKICEWAGSGINGDTSLSWQEYDTTTRRRYNTRVSIDIIPPVRALRGGPLDISLMAALVRPGFETG